VKIGSKKIGIAKGYAGKAEFTKAKVQRFGIFNQKCSGTYALLSGWFPGVLARPSGR
jgi:hypothetical protein